VRVNTINLKKKNDSSIKLLEREIIKMPNFFFFLKKKVANHKKTKK
jgi:hypothetical protein